MGDPSQPGGAPAHGGYRYRLGIRVPPDGLRYRLQPLMDSARRIAGAGRWCGWAETDRHLVFAFQAADHAVRFRLWLLAQQWGDLLDAAVEPPRDPVG